MNACPWIGFEPTTLHFCEAVECAWIAQPANAWSSLAYVLVGLYAWRRRHRLEDPVLRSVGLMAIAVGITSFFFHATMSFLGEVLDIGSMFFFSGMILTLNLKRLGWVSGRAETAFYWGLTLLSILVLATVKGSGPLLFGGQVVLGVALELALARRERQDALPAADRRAYFTSLGFFAVSYGIWILDATQTVCAPDNHLLQGHAIWHLLNSGVFVWMQDFYSQFDFQKREISVTSSAQSLQTD